MSKAEEFAGLVATLEKELLIIQACVNAMERERDRLREENERLKNRVQHLARRLRDCCSGAFVAIAIADE